MLNEGLEALKDGYNAVRRYYYGIFQYCDFEEITLPSTLNEIGAKTLSRCDDLRAIYVKSGCQADLSQLEKPSSAQIVWV